MVLCFDLLSAADWPMRGKDGTRNAVSLEKNAPVEWEIGTLRGELPEKRSRNIRWSARLGSVTWCDPVIADGLVWVGTNNDQPRNARHTQDAGVLMCFRQRDGKFLYQHVSPRLKQGTRLDWPFSGLASSPLIEGNRLWFCNNRHEIICLDIRPLHTSGGEPRVVWKVDMRKELGVVPTAVMIGNNAIQCSIASYDALIYVQTGNARYVDKVPAPEAPSLVCLDKRTGRTVWTDNSPGGRILDVQHGSPLVVEVDGSGQAIMGQGDGWLRSFDALTGQLLWEFDINLKAPGPKSITRGNWNYFIATPVYYGNRIYVGSGRHADWGSGPGRLCCIDPTRRGDISSELDDGSGRGKPNPNSGLVWEYLGMGGDPMHRTMSSVTIHNNFIVAPDHGGLVHCLDARTGRRYWTHDVAAKIFCSSLIADGKVYVGDEDGDLVVLELSQEKKQLIEHNFSAPIYSSPVYSNGVLYVATYEYLHAIEQERR